MKSIKENNLKDYATLKLILLLFCFFILWLFTAKYQKNILWFIIIGTVSIVYIVKNKNIEKIDILIGIILGLVSMPSSFIMGFFTIIAYIGAVSEFKSRNNKIKFFKSDNKNIFISVILILVVGGVLSAINIFGALNSLSINFSIKLQWFLDAFSAGITEEVLFRFFFFAVCITIVNDKQLSKFQNFICYLIMILPHTLIHFNINTFNISNIIMLSVLFGLPFAILQRKRDLVSAIGSHTLVDLIRFCLLGV